MASRADSVPVSLHGQEVSGAKRAIGDQHRRHFQLLGNEIRAAVPVPVQAGQAASQVFALEELSGRGSLQFDEPPRARVAEELRPHLVRDTVMAQVADVSVDHHQVRTPVQFGVQELAAEPQHVEAR